MKEKDIEFYQKRISDAWADIRTLGSNLWQVMMLSIAASAVIINLISRQDSEGTLILFSWIGWFALVILSGFTFFATSAVIWISKATIERIRMIDTLMVYLHISEKPIRIDSELQKEKDGYTITSKAIYRIVNWIPTKKVVIFSMIMWSISVTFLYPQVLLTFQNDINTIVTLILLQAILSLVMLFYIEKEYSELSKELYFTKMTHEKMKKDPMFA